MMECRYIVEAGLGGVHRGQATFPYNSHNAMIGAKRAMMDYVLQLPAAYTVKVWIERREQIDWIDELRRQKEEEV